MLDMNEIGLRESEINAYGLVSRVGILPRARLFIRILFCDRRGFVIVDMFCRGKDLGKEMHIIQKTWPATGCKSKKKNE